MECVLLLPVSSQVFASVFCTQKDDTMSYFKRLEADFEVPQLISLLGNEKKSVNKEMEGFPAYHISFHLYGVSFNVICTQYKLSSSTARVR